jgi:hypothetical protein
MMSRQLAGRTTTYTTQELADTIRAYFLSMETIGKPAIITGLCGWLGFDRRYIKEQIAKWVDSPDEDHRAKADILQKAIQAIESCRETELASGRPPIGPIFLLKNMGWTDGQDQGSGNIQVNIQIVE